MKKLLLFALLLAMPASANVSLKNGNFFIGFTDVSYPGGFEPKIERVYNSKSAFRGIFGFGWGIEYEVRLQVSADGSVVVHEYGGGAENRFQPVRFEAKELDAAVEKIAGVARSVGVMGSAAALEDYKKKLRGDASFRNSEWQKWVSQGKLEPRKLADGTQLQSNRFSYQYLTKVKDGYVRVYDNGRIEKFDDLGRLSQLADRNGNKLGFEYGRDGKLSKLIDNFNRKMFFTFNERGLLSRVQGESKQVAEYRYNGFDELVWSKDASGNAHEFKYSDDQRHNLVQVTYPDKRALKIAYYDRKQFENVRTITEKDGTLIEYSYKENPPSGANRIVAVVMKDRDSKPITKSEYEYFFRKKATGEEWTQRMVTTTDGERTDTTYNECCGAPLVIKKGNETTEFAYDAKGRVTKKATPTEITRLTYDEKLGKITRVVKEPSPKSARKAAPTWSEFEYDTKGNLISAKNSAKQAVKVIYDGNGRIANMIDQQGRKLEFRYNEQSKPVEIKDAKIGAIQVTYGNDGAVKSVASPAGRKIAMQVTSTFQNLLEIIRPAGVTLSF